VYAFGLRKLHSSSNYDRAAAVAKQLPRVKINAQFDDDSEPPLPALFGEDDLYLQSAAGGHYAKWKRHTTASQEALRCLAFSLVERTSDGRKIYRRREIGTVDQIPDLETARRVLSYLFLA